MINARLRRRPFQKAKVRGDYPLNSALTNHRVVRCVLNLVIISLTVYISFRMSWTDINLNSLRFR